ncbi:MAG: glutathione S-transferase family protein [Rhodospirillaceae bacterium]
MTKMDPALVLYTHPLSRGRIARWMLEEVGQLYETRILSYETDMKADAFLKLNPLGKVPTVTHGERVITESAAICAYLADAFPEAGLAPALQDRAAYYRWLFFVAGPVESAICDLSMGVNPEGIHKRMVGYFDVATMIAALETALPSDPSAGPWIGGSHQFTAADVYVGSQIRWGLQFDWLPERPLFTSYVARCGQRPAFQRALQIDDDLIEDGVSKGTIGAPGTDEV